MKTQKKSLKLSCIILFLLFMPLICQAHVHMEKSWPAKGESLDTPPGVVKLWFSGGVEAEWSKVEVKDKSGKRVDTKEVTATDSDPNSLQVQLKSISSGNYDVRWNVISHDGHRIKGGISFTVK